MNRFLLIVLSVVGLVATTGAQNKQGMNKVQNSKTLVAYFSATGTTARAAEKVAKITGGELYAITPAQSYTPADLDWNNSQSRSSVEMNDPKSRPALKGKKENIADYDVIFIGYPIWWNLAPRPKSILPNVQVSKKEYLPYHPNKCDTIRHCSYS